MADTPTRPDLADDLAAVGDQLEALGAGSAAIVVWRAGEELEALRDELAAAEKIDELIREARERADAVSEYGDRCEALGAVKALTELKARCSADG